MNCFGPLGKRLEWLSSGPRKQVTYLDLSLKLVNGRVRATTYEKPLNLHLYIPAFSAHSPSMARGLIFGMLRRFWLQNFCTEDYTRLAREFFHSMVARGYDEEFLKEEFFKAASKLDRQVLSGANDADEGLVFLHLQYHPFQVTRREIQSIFRQTCADTLLNAKSDRIEFERLGIKRLVVAQSRAINLRDRLCRSRLELSDGKRAADFVYHLRERNGADGSAASS